MSEIHTSVQEYYGKELEKSEDLKTNACCTLTAPPKHIMEALREVHDEVQAKYYGCGLTIPSKVEGLKILDLGSGSGRDCYIAAKLVGEHGEVVGVDMTDEQLAVANKHIEYHREQFGYATSNVRFLKGNIEALDELDLEPGSFDLIISNCVINLAENKEKVLRDAFALLKSGGEMYFSDVYADRRFPVELQKDPVLWGECISGALYWNDFLNIAKRVGFTDPRAVENKVITVENPELEEKLGDINCFSVTYRLFKIDGLESDCEDYGQAVKYKGTIAEEKASFDLDDHHNFPAGKVMPVCGNTYKMLHDTRFKEDFEFYGDWSTHYGIFEGCGGAMPFSVGGEDSAAASCC
ncbi:Methyltransferase domain-containing protein [Lishizhenia tianjinensis]|uniref:Arsenite methyltransferase n=1 Tax=Lishizhenia tianjinensis TaxID=477690 RepID=A0A1I7A1B3_9FLAO|nr:methyltransferase domain-containing protein [Lishizhenia tianjinensis]SFT68726.1 Methyltransferase domain-containing protein [Lishizhenia tianjinensis]